MPGSTHRTWKSPTTSTAVATPISTRPKTSEIGSNACRSSPSHMSHLHVPGADAQPQHQPLALIDPWRADLTGAHEHARMNTVMLRAEHVHVSHRRAAVNVPGRDAGGDQHLEL